MFIKLQQLLDSTRALDFLAPLALRLYLAPIFWMAGTDKIDNFSDRVDWFGNPDWGLGLPFPTLLTGLATAAEAGGAVLLLFGLGVRWVSIPLMVTMLVAIFSVHWNHGWQIIADAKFCMFNCADAIDASNRLSAAKDILREYGNYDWLTGQGGITILNNGIEMGATYFIMLLALFFIGGGRYFSADYWIAKRFLHRE